MADAAGRPRCDTCPRFRRGDVTREADLIEEVARLDDLQALPASTPASPRSHSGRLTPAPAAAPRGERRPHRAGGARGGGLELRQRRACRRACVWPTRPRSSSRIRCRPSRRGCARRSSARCSTSPSATAPAAPAPCALFEAGAVYLPARRRARRPMSPITSALCCSAPCARPTWREPDPPRGRLLRRQGRPGRRARRAARGLDAWRRGSRAVPAPRARGAHPHRRRAGRMAGRAASGSSPPTGTSSDTVAGFELDLDAVARTGATPLFVDVTSFPEVREDIAVARPRHGERRSASSRSPPRRRPAARPRRGLRRLPRRRAARGGQRLARAAPRLHRSVRPHAHRRGGGGRPRGDRHRARRRASERGSVAERPTVAVFGAAGVRGRARRPHRAPSIPPSSSRPGDRAQRTPARRLDDVYPHHRVPPASSRSSTSTGTPMSRRRSSPTRTAPPRRTRGGAVRARSPRRRPQRRLPPARPRCVRRVVPRAPGPRAHRGGGVRAARGLPRGDSPAPGSGQPRLLPDRDDARAVAAPRAGARAGDIVVDAKSGVSGAGRAATEQTHFVTVDENVNAYGVEEHRHTPEIEQELAALGARVPITFIPHLLPLDQGELVSCYVTPPTAGRSAGLARAVPRGLRARAVRRGGHATPGVRDVRETNFCRISSTATAHRAGDRVRRHRQPVEGRRLQAVQNLNLMLGRPEAEGLA